MRNPHGLMTPAQVCQLLRITPDQINSLLERGWLEVAFIDKMRNGEMRLFDKSKIDSLIPQMPNIRRAWMAEDNHRYGGSAAARKRENDRRQAEELKNRKQRYLSELSDCPEPYDRILRACFYLYHLNHYAKRGESYLYDLKEHVLRILSRLEGLAGPAITVYFVPGSERVRLCSRCQERAGRLNKTRPEYIRLYGGCPQCTRDSNYYSLYEFVVAYDNYRFCFHVPYTAARKWFRNQPPPPKEGRAKREGFTVFGRPILAAEAQAVELIEVIEELESFIQRFAPGGDWTEAEGSLTEEPAPGII